MRTVKYAFASIEQARLFENAHNEFITSNCYIQKEFLHLFKQQVASLVENIDTGFMKTSVFLHLNGPLPMHLNFWSTEFRVTYACMDFAVDSAIAAIAARAYIDLNEQPQP